MQKLLIITFMLTYAAYSGAEEYSLAYSKKLGVEVFATGGKNSWCTKKPQLSLIADKKSFFTNGNVDSLLNKVGKGIIEKKCPQASSLSIVGAIKGTATQELTGSANKNDGWKLVKHVLEKKKDSLLTDKSLTDKPLPKLDTRELFSVAGWRPNLHDGLSITPSLKMLEIYNEQKTCKIRLHPYSYTGFKGYYDDNFAGKGTCANGYLEGPNKVKIHSTKANKVRLSSLVDAHFVNGIPFAKRAVAINKPFLKLLKLKGSSKYKYIDLAFYLGSSEAHKVHFVGSSHWAYSRRHVVADICPQLEIHMYTVNEELFENKTMVHELELKAFEYAREICPNNRTIVLNGSEPPKSQIFATYFQAKYDVTKGYKPVYVLNQPLMEKQARIRKANIAYSKLADVTLNQRLSYLHDVERIDNPLRYFLTGLGTQEMAAGSFFARVSEVDDDFAETDWPIEMKLTNVVDQIEEPGWYIFTGNAEIENEDEIDRYGYPKGIVDVTRVTACKQEACGEASDTIQLIRTKFKLPGWEPLPSQGKK